MRQHLVDDGVIVAAVVGRAARNEIRKLLVPDHVAAAHFETVEPELVRHLVDGALDGVVGRRLAEGAHRLLHRLVGDHGDGLILHALDLVRPDDGADRLAELERRAPGIGADVVERAHLHRADDALAVERDLDVEEALRPVHVAAAHVLQPVLDQPHRHAEALRQIADQHGVLDAALDAVAAADVDVVVHAHRRHRDLQRHRGLVGIFRHLDRGPDVEDLAPGVPARRHAEGLDRHGRAAAPFDAVLEPMRARGEILLDLAPDEGAVEQHVGAVRLMHQRAAGVGLVGIEHERQRLVFDGDRLGRVLSERARVGHHRRDPFAGIARHVQRQRIARHVRRIEAGGERVGRAGKLRAFEHVMHARHRQRRGLVDRDDARRRIRARHQRDVLDALRHDIGGEIALADDEAAILAHPAVGRDEAEFSSGALMAAPP